MVIIKTKKFRRSRKSKKIIRLGPKILQKCSNPESPDYLCWGISRQNLVDAAFIVESFLRAYDELWIPLDDITKQRYITELIKLREIDPPYTNWF